MTGDNRGFSPVQKLVISEVLIAAVIALSAMAFNGLYAQKPTVEQKDLQAASLNVDAYKVTSVNVQELLTGFGTAQADREVILAAQVTGEIVDINPHLKVGYAVVAEEMLVSADQPSRRRNAELLLKIDPREYQQRVDQAASRIAETKTEIDQLNVQQTSVARQLMKATSVVATLKEEYDRIQQGVKRKAASASDLNRALLELQRYEDTIIQLENQGASIPHQIAAANHRLVTSNSEKDRAEDNLAKTEIHPPFSGVLSEVFVEKGQYVRAGEPLVRLTNLSRVEVPISLGFDDFLQLEDALKKGRKPRVSLAENETVEPRWQGSVVRAAAEADSASRTVQIFVEVTNADADARLLPGSFVHARINGGVYDEAILIPRESIVDGHVFVVDAQNITRRKLIKVGRRLQSMVIVEEGLLAGDRVVMTNLDIVEDGDEVVVQSVCTPEDEIRSLRSPELRLLKTLKP